MPVGTLSTANAAAEVAAEGAGNPDTSQVGGDYQNGAFSIGTLQPAGLNRCLVQQLASVARVLLPLTDGVHWAANSETGQYAVTLHIGDTLTLSPVPANASNQETSFTSPAGNIGFLFSSRQSHVVTCDVDKNTFAASTTIRAVGTGETTVEVISPRAVNAGFASAQPSATAGGSGCTLRVIVIE